MSTVSQGVKRTESYVYNSLHWAFPLAPVLALSTAFGPWPVAIRIAFIAATVVASLAGLSVLHTALRDADLLPPSGWDAVRVGRLTPVVAVWAVASVATVLLAGTPGWRDLFSAITVPGYLGGALALPLLALPRASGRPVRPVLVGLVAIVLAEAALWGHPRLLGPRAAGPPDHRRLLGGVRRGRGRGLRPDVPQRAGHHP